MGILGSLTKRKAKKAAGAAPSGAESTPKSGGDQLGNALPADQLGADPAPKTGFSAWLAKTFNTKGHEAKEAKPADPEPAAAKAKSVTWGGNYDFPGSAAGQPKTAQPKSAAWGGNYDFAGSAGGQPKAAQPKSAAWGGNYDFAHSAAQKPQATAQVAQKPADGGAHGHADALRDDAHAHNYAAYKQGADEPADALHADADAHAHNYAAYKQGADEPADAHAHNYAAYKQGADEPADAHAHNYAAYKQGADEPADAHADPLRDAHADHYAAYKQGADEPADPLRAAEPHAYNVIPDAGPAHNYDVVGEGHLAPPVQAPVAGGEVRTPQVAPTPAAGLADTQKRMRAGGRSNLVDSPEIAPSGKAIAVRREDKSAEERRAGGWATLGVRTHHRGLTGNDAKGGINKKEAVGYFKPQAELEQRKALKDANNLRALAELDADIGANVDAARGKTRESQVLRFADGKWVDADGRDVDTSSTAINMQTYWEKKTLWDRDLDALQSQIALPEAQAKITALQSQLLKIGTHAGQKELGLAGRYIFVMNAAGEFFAGMGMTGIVHHSSFLAGGAVACAGEIALSGGRVTLISNASGHYRPGPAYLWQACKQFEALGVPLDGVKVQILGLSEDFASAAEFLASMDPSRDATMFDGNKALNHLRAYQKKKDANPAPVRHEPPAAGGQSPIVPM